MNDQLTNLEIAAMAQEEKYRQQVEIMRKIYTAAGFFQYYFDLLPDYPTSIECFNAVNDLHEELFFEPRYSSFTSFQNQLRKYLKK